MKKQGLLKEDALIHIVCTYEKTPKSIEEAERVAKNYLRRIDYRRKKLGLSPLRYTLDTKYIGFKKEKQGVFHHIVVNSGISCEDLELMWTTRRINWGQFNDPCYRGEIRLIGYIETDKLPCNGNEVEELYIY